MDRQTVGQTYYNLSSSWSHKISKFIHKNNNRWWIKLGNRAEAQTNTEQTLFHFFSSKTLKTKSYILPACHFVYRCKLYWPDPHDLERPNTKPDWRHCPHDPRSRVSCYGQRRRVDTWRVFQFSNEQETGSGLLNGIKRVFWDRVPGTLDNLIWEMSWVRNGPLFFTAFWRR